MDQKQMMKQIIEFNKTSFNNTYEAILMLNEQAEKVTESLISAQPSFLPENKKVLDEWANAYKKGCIELKDTVNSNFDKLEEYILK